MKPIRAIAFLVLAGGLVGLYIYLTERPTSAALRPELVVNVRAAPPSVRDWDVKLRYPAELHAIQLADIRSVDARGTIRDIFVDKGDVVRRGQRLVSVDCPDYEKRRVAAEALVRDSTASHENARRTYQRLEPMFRQKFISGLEHDRAHTRNAASGFHLQHAKARLAEVEESLRYCEISAPFAGEVSARIMDPGQQVRPGGRPILQLMQIDKLRVWVSVVEKEAPHVREGLPVNLHVYAMPGRVFRGEVTRFSRGLDPASRTLLAEIVIDNEDALLRPGMFGHATLIVEKRPKALIVKESAILSQACGVDAEKTCHWVYVVEGERSRRVPVTLGQKEKDEVEVRSGLAASAKVVFAGRDLLGEGTRVRLLR